MSEQTKDGRTPDVEKNPAEVMDREQTKALAAAGGGSIAAFQDMRKFEAAQRMAKALAASSLVPQAYQGDLANCLVAMELASRTDASVFMVMQNLDVIHGRPSWRAQFLIAAVNATGRFTPLRYEFQGEKGTDSWGCRAVAKEKDSGEVLEGPLVTIQTAKDEGWYGRKGSKWQSIPGLMLRYRAGAWWSRVFCPEIALGMQTVEESLDATEADVSGVVQQKTEARLAEMKAELEEARKNGPEPEVVEAEVEGAESRDGPDHEIVTDEEDAEPSEYELAKQAYHRACQKAGLGGPQRLAWQEEHMDERSSAKWSTDDFLKATDMLQSGIGVGEDEPEVETDSTSEPDEEEMAEAAERAAQGEMPY